MFRVIFIGGQLASADYDKKACLENDVSCILIQLTVSF